MSTTMDSQTRPAPAAADLRAAILGKCRESMATKEQFFSTEADRIAQCAAAMARIC
jgi:hypothetical protein